MPPVYAVTRIRPKIKPQCTVPSCTVIWNISQRLIFRFFLSLFFLHFSIEVFFGISRNYNACDEIFYSRVIRNSSFLMSVVIISVSLYHDNYSCQFSYINHDLEKEKKNKQ